MTFGTTGKGGAWKWHEINFFTLDLFTLSINIH